MTEKRYRQRRSESVIFPGTCSVLNDIVTLALACAWREIGNISTTDRRTEEKLHVTQHLPGHLLGSNYIEKLALACAWRDVGADITGKWKKPCFLLLFWKNER